MKQVNVRLPNDIHAALADLAAKDRRSLNAMVIILIEQEKQRRKSVPASSRP